MLNEILSNRTSSGIKSISDEIVDIICEFEEQINTKTFRGLEPENYNNNNIILAFNLIKNALRTRDQIYLNKTNDEMEKTLKLEVK